MGSDGSSLQIGNLFQANNIHSQLHKYTIISIALK